MTVLIIFFGVVLIVLLFCNLMVIFASAGRTYDRAYDVPHNRVGLLLGTSPITRWGTHNKYFDARIEATDSLYKAGKIDYIILSGGNYVGKEKYGCDEPAAMRDSLVSRGVPAEKMVLDYEGTRTLNSLVKAKEVYGQDNLTLISQGYHNKRALYLAKHSGIQAVAYNAEEPDLPLHILRNHMREYMANVKLFVDLATQKKPTFKENHIPIGDDKNPFK